MCYQIYDSWRLSSAHPSWVLWPWCKRWEGMVALKSQNLNSSLYYLKMHSFNENNISPLILSSELLSCLALSFSQVAISSPRCWHSVVDGAGSPGCLGRAGTLCTQMCQLPATPWHQQFVSHSSTWAPFQQHEQPGAPGEASWPTWQRGYS